MNGAYSQPSSFHHNFHNCHHHRNELLDLCQSNAWSAALQRWRSFPQEALPIPLPPWCRKKRGRAEPNESFSKLQEDNLMLYQPTVLGMICASQSIGSTESDSSSSAIRILLDEVLKYSPTQVACSQVSPQQAASCSELVYGSTPLRAAVMNPHCPLDVLKMLLQADQDNCRRYPNYVPASHQIDSHGLSPLDHLFRRLHHSDMATTGASPIEFLETFLEMRPPAPNVASKTSNTTISAKVSPLLRLLTAVEPLPFVPLLEPTRANEEAPTARFYKIRGIIWCLLRQEPELLYVCSSATGCSPLHVAARTTCNFLPILKDLISADKKKQLIGMANNFGDLPIHIVCSNGAGLEVLQFLASTTADYDRRLLWATTGFGYTPSDLLWLNHIEAGSSFVKIRTFHSMYAATEARFEKDNEYYQKVLRESVNLLTNGDSSEPTTTTLERMERAKRTFDGLLDRLFVLLSATSTNGEAESLADRKYLHIACMVCTPYCRSLALPLFKLLLWIFKEDLLTVDASGSLPLHHALGSNFLPKDPQSTERKAKSTQKDQEVLETQWKEWSEYCQELIKAAPESCGMVNLNGQLPLHLLLSHRPPGSNSVAQQLHRDLIDKMVEAFPESEHTRDPVSGLDPFMLASVADDALDTIYNLLRRCPNLCQVNDNGANQ